MATEISWTDEAIETFNKKYWVSARWVVRKEVAKFIQQTLHILERLKKFPLSYPAGLKNKKYRRARLNKYIALFYRYYKSKDEIVLITFWNVKQDPNKLKY